MTDFCEIADDVPEMLQAPVAVGAGIQALVRRHRVRRWWPARGLDFQAGLPPGNTVAGAVQDARRVHAAVVRRARERHVAEHSRSTTGGLVTYSETANGVTTFARTTSTTLGRPLTNSAAVVNVAPAGTLWGDRLNQIDFRFTKILGLPTGRLDLNLDVYNAFNSDAITTELNSVGPGVWSANPGDSAAIREAQREVGFLGNGRIARVVQHVETRRTPRFSVRSRVPRVAGRTSCVSFAASSRPILFLLAGMLVVCSGGLCRNSSPLRLLRRSRRLFRVSRRGRSRCRPVPCLPKIRRPRAFPAARSSTHRRRLTICETRQTGSRTSILPLPCGS